MIDLELNIFWKYLINFIQSQLGPDTASSLNSFLFQFRQHFIILKCLNSYIYKYSFFLHMIIIIYTSYYGACHFGYNLAFSTGNYLHATKFKPQIKFQMGKSWTQNCIDQIYRLNKMFYCRGQIFISVLATIYMKQSLNHRLSLDK